MTPAISLPDSGTLDRWRQSFLSLNAQRLQAARDQLSHRQQAVLDALPALLHVNSTRLPGFVTPDTPCGIHGFQPGKAEHSALHQVARGIALPKDPGQSCIEGVFLMGSLGSIAQSRQSDLDVWLCHDESLSDAQVEQLQEKCQRIEQWAETQSTELHFFVMNLRDFRQGQSRSAEGEDCGSTQQLLLLDEFYRSGLWLAGKTPQWWVLPNEYENQAEATWASLVEHGLIDVRQWLDVGWLPTIPAGEFVGAGLWQLNKGLSSPYKSLLKLLLCCEYASHYPNIRPLAWDLKTRVHQDDVDPAHTDAYLLMLERLEAYASPENRDLMRRAFYIKTGIRLTQLHVSKQGQWRTLALRALVQQWEWSQATLMHLDERKHWSPADVMKERAALVTLMLQSYRTLAAFSDEHADAVHIQPDDLTLLGNRLYAAFRPTPGKIAEINPGIRNDMEEAKLTLNLVRDRWQLIPGAWRPGESYTALTQSASLMEVLLFARRNGLLTRHTHVALYPTYNPVSQYELRALLHDVLAITPLPPPPDAFRRDAHTLAWHVFINPGVNPQHALSRRGMQKISNRDDALGFGSGKENLVHSIELLTINSWGEWQVTHYQGDEAMHDALMQILSHRHHLHRHPWPSYAVHCHCQVRAAAIYQRVHQLLEDVTAHMSAPHPPPYLLQTGERFYLLEYRKGDMISHRAADHAALIALLARPRRRFRRWGLDAHALPVSPLRCILSEARGGEWHVWYWRQPQRTYVYVMDHCGALSYHPTANTDIRAALVPLLRFLRQLNQRWSEDHQRPAWPLVLSELQSDPETGAFSSAPRRLPQEAQVAPSLHLRAHCTDHGPVTFEFDQDRLSTAELGAEAFRRTRDAVIQARPAPADQPVWLSDLTVNGNQQLVHHLHLRQRLEHLLNHPPESGSSERRQPAQ